MDPSTSSIDTATHSQGILGSAVFIQDICYLHRFIRSRDSSTIVERPERLRAVKIGLAAAIARIEDTATFPARSASDSVNESATASDSQDQADDLVVALDRMHLAGKVIAHVPIINSSASVDILNHPAIKFIHGDIDGDIYLENLKQWVKDSEDKITKGESEIPEGLSQGDLYLCPGSMDAIQGAIGTVCEAVDTVINSSRISDGEIKKSVVRRAFVAIRPPGHHCGEDSPSGFCFVNNVAIGAAHAHLRHGINRVVILDIDLHHGNGTQAIAWQINEETYRQTLEAESGDTNDQPHSKPGPQIYYGSIHDILSYPCEDGKAVLVQAGSVSLHGPHGQYIENIHLEPYSSEEHFWRTLYKNRYSRLIKQAEAFVEATGGAGDDVLVFISCGFDACEHEYPSMSRHNRKVPASFYHRFTKDARAFADRYAQGRLVSVLEGGYSDHALISGAMAHLTGLVDLSEGAQVDEGWWSIDNVIKLEKATQKRKGGRQSVTTQPIAEAWLERAVTLFSTLDAGSAQYMPPPSSRGPIPPSSMTLRERKKPGFSAESTPTSSPSPGKGKRKDKLPEEAKNKILSFSVSDEVSSARNRSPDSEPVVVPKKLPRVILHVRPPPDT